MCTNIINDSAGFDGAWPLDGGWYAKAALPLGGLLVTEHRGTAVGPAEELCAVVGGIHDDGVVCDPQLVEPTAALVAIFAIWFINPDLVEPIFLLLPILYAVRTKFRQRKAATEGDREGDGDSVTSSN